MKKGSGSGLRSAVACLLAIVSNACADSNARIGEIGIGQGQVRLRIEPPDPLWPALDGYRVWRADNLSSQFREDTTGVTEELDWTGQFSGPGGFFRIEPRPLTHDELLATTLLYRLSYGPTPDELERVRAIGPDAYIEEQLSPEKIPDNTRIDVLPETDANGWVHVSITGAATKANPDFYIYLKEIGESYLDGVRLVQGEKEDESKPNLLINGDFDSGLNSWTVSTNLLGSAISTLTPHSGSGSLHLVSSETGSTRGSSIWQASSGITSGAIYTLSFWYLGEGGYARPVLRFSGATDTGGINSERVSDQLWSQLLSGDATLDQLRSWHLRHAVESNRQLLEVMRQFWENHFVTQYSKSAEYFDQFYQNGSDGNGPAAANCEFRENLKWREAMLRPDCTFYDLLRISAESPAMIIYLDLVTSRGNLEGTKRNVANENYARELCELFTFGVDNGYDQEDIIQLSRAWSGWRIEFLALSEQDNPLLDRTKKLKVYRNPNITDAAERDAVPNLVGAWSFLFRTDRHDERDKYIFFERDDLKNPTAPKRIPARFGAPWAGREYQLVLKNGGGTNGIADGYQVLRHMADQPFTQEYLSVKLARLFVHDGFQLGYNFADEETSPEEELIHACMLAWENPPSGGKKGQMRDVLKVIFKSELFQSHSASLQKVKTPLEYAISTIRALRARKADGSYTAKGTSGELLGVMNSAGRMRLFDRAEPDGYAEDAAAWISAGTLAQRLRFVQTVFDPSNQATDIDPITLIKLKRPDSIRDAGAVADYFVTTLFPAEGRANLIGFRKLAMDFLNTADDGKTASPFANLDPSQNGYATRLRGMVAFLMTTQRFQEQ